MSEPQRQSVPGTGEEPAQGIGEPAVVPPQEAAPTAQQTDPGGYPHEPSSAVPRIPADGPLRDRDDDTAEDVPAGPGEAAGEHGTENGAGEHDTGEHGTEDGVGERGDAPGD